MKKLLLILIFIACQAMGQVAKTNSATYSYTNDFLPKIPIIVSSSTNSMILVQGMAGTPAGIDSVVLYGGGHGRLSKLTFLDSLSYSGAFPYISLWYVLSPHVGNDTVWIYNNYQWSGSDYVAVFSGVNQSAPFGTVEHTILTDQFVVTRDITLESNDLGYIGLVTSSNIPEAYWVGQGTTETIEWNVDVRRYIVGTAIGTGITTVGWNTSTWGAHTGEVVISAVPIKSAPPPPLALAPWMAWAPAVIVYDSVFDTVSIQGRNGTRSESTDLEDTTNLRCYYSSGAPNYYDLGVQFTLAISQGATIDSAFVTLWTGVLTNITSSDSLWIRVANVDNGTRFVAGEHTYIAQHEAAWVADSLAWSEAWTDFTNFETPDIKAFLQPVINRAGWVSGNYVIVRFRPYTGAEYRRWMWGEATEGTVIRRPRIRVYYH